MKEMRWERSRDRKNRVWNCKRKKHKNFNVYIYYEKFYLFILYAYIYIYEYTFGLCKSVCMFMMRIEDFILSFVNFEAWLLEVNIDEVHTGAEKKFKIGHSGSFKSVIKHGVNSMLQELLLQQS